MDALIDNLLEFATQGQAPGDELVDLSHELELALDDLAARVSTRVRAGRRAADGTR